MKPRSYGGHPVLFYQSVCPSPFILTIFLPLFRVDVYPLAFFSFVFMSLSIYQSPFSFTTFPLNSVACDLVNGQKTKFPRIFAVSNSPCSRCRRRRRRVWSITTFSDESCDEFRELKSAPKTEVI